MYIGIHVKYPSFSSDFTQTLNFSTDFRKILTSNFMKIRPVEAEFHAATGQADRYNEAKSHFSQFCEYA
jgi:hypothetical protein